MTTTHPPYHPVRWAIRLVTQTLVLLAVLAALLFMPAGRWDWPQAWAFVLAYGVFLLVYAAQWSVRPAEVTGGEQAPKTVAEHVRASHPGVRSVQVYRQSWGPYPRRAYLWLEEYASLAALESEPETSDCAVVWQPVEAMAETGTYVCNMWSDLNRAIGLTR